jgi:AAA domain
MTTTRAPQDDLEGLDQEYAADAGTSPGPNGAAGAAQTGAQQPRALCLTLAEWAARDIAPQDRLLGDPFSTTTRTQLSADTGLGKTMFGLGTGLAMCLGTSFLSWTGHRPATVLYLDGEMPRELIQQRLAAAASWFGLETPLSDGFYLLSREDVEDMPPLDTPEGARWVLDFISKLGRIDHVTFDNIASLTATCLKEEDGARALRDLQRELTKQQIGQLWEHHTGHDTTRGYGTKMREWSLDTAMVAEKLDRPGADVAFTLKFPKCRRRTPDNRNDFETIEVTLEQGQWLHQPAEKGAGGDRSRSLGCNQQHVLNAATKLLAGPNTKIAPPGHPARANPVITVDALKHEARQLIACDQRHFASRFDAALNSLTATRNLNHYDAYVWL